MTIRATLIAGAALVAFASPAFAHDFYVQELNIYTSEDWAALNPQPLPPKEVAIEVFQPGEEVMLNPQPLPPGETYEGAILAPGGDVMLNPQPLPPREFHRDELGYFGF
jgi:hypothetical protein